MSTSSIAQLRQHISNQQQAAQQGMSGLAAVASHRSITARMEHAWSRVEALRATGHEQQAQVLLTSDRFYELCGEGTTMRGQEQRR